MRYSVKAAAMATGVSASRLRTWERRYAIPKPGRSATGRRLYDENDLAVIRRMAALVRAGVPASEAAEAARIEARGAAGEPSEATAEQNDDPRVAPLVQAAVNYDEGAIVGTIHELVASTSWGGALDEVLFPTLRRAGEYWGAGTLVTANEHFLSEVIRRELSAGLSATPDSEGDAPSVLLACAEGDRHDLGLLAVCLLLRLRGLRVTYLGADVPAHDLVEAAQRTRSEALCLSATTASALGSLGRTARGIVSSRLSIRLFVGGPALDAAELKETIPGIHLPPSIQGAADLIAATLEGSRRTRQPR
jgi:DNA-binding transcriptional MerR regulator/methylmalonyl-CoA mutase cobalamin-binding subunit